MATFDSWESYFYPETYNPLTQDGTLRNLYGERDAATLHDLECGVADRRSVELRLGIADVPRTYDAEHIRAIHGYLFQGVYEWAGQFRTVDAGLIPSEQDELHMALGKGERWARSVTHE